jgi:hypothetical protein
MNLSTFWKPKKKMGFILKSGAEIRFRCTDIEWKYNSQTLAIESYSLKEVSGIIPRHVVPSEIAAIVRYN